MRFILIVLMSLVSLPLAARADGVPAGYIVALTLAAADKTPVKRGDEWLAAKLMMPLYQGDFVKLADARSSITLETGEGSDVEIRGDGKLYAVTGHVATGDDAAGVIAAIGSALAGEEPGAAENMASRGGEAISVGVARHGTNLVRAGADVLWLSWSGGTAPFRVSIRRGAAETAAMPVAARDITLPLHLNMNERATVLISDAAAGRARVELRGGDEPPPPAVIAAARGRTVAVLLRATWLMRQAKGAWRLQAAQLLHAQAARDKAAAELLRKVSQGWSP